MRILQAEARRFANTVKWSWAGWAAARASEKTLRQWTVVSIASATLAFRQEISPAERVLILGLLVLAAALLNTAVEEAVNDIPTDLHPLAEKAKDGGSAGVSWQALLLG